ncbi:hypothetical protein Clacol_005552 [Clathrus columnatus]|uniref:ubiquitinyl hydrolase 1 n=1 Tax=Clathrus columnatus TaxID=1419009 RepID=A0AAV5AHA8_9AGAM|nr:hypothetical protein Clacol_005552 [Clathrus columnatus]
MNAGTGKLSQRSMVALTMTSTKISPRLTANGGPPSSPDTMSVSEIKESAKSSVQRIKNASAQNLLKAAKDQSTNASLEENSGDLRSALRAYIMASSLIQAIYDSSEYKLEYKDATKRGVFWKDFKDFSNHFMTNSMPRVQRLEAKLKDAEQVQKYTFLTHYTRTRSGLTTICASESSDSKANNESGPARSIQERIQALQGQGLTVAAKPKRVLTSVPPSPHSHPPALASKQPPSISSPIQSQFRPLPSSPSHIPSSVSTPHTFVSTTSFGPPSPTSSVASSPPSIDVHAIPTTVISAASPSTSPISSRHASYPTRTESEFIAAFPTIDEMDEQTPFPTVPTDDPGVTLPSVPSNRPGDGLPPPPSSARDLKPYANHGFAVHNTGSSSSSMISPLSPTKLSTIDRHPPHHRPSSTPIPPLSNGIGHPDSPPERSPITSPRRELPSPPVASPTSHSNPNYSTKTPLKHTPSESFKPKPDLPVTSTIYPKLLKEYRSTGRKILLLDIRTRAEFDTERIKWDEIVCLEPSILTRDNITSATIESALVVAPSSERALFTNRAKFELVVMYDASSGLPSSPMFNLARAIFETDFSQSLKRPPVLLVGGLEAWKQEMGEEGIHRSSLSQDNGVMNALPMNNNNNLVHSSSVGHGLVSQLPSNVPTLPVSQSPPSTNVSMSSDGHERWLPPRPQSRNEFERPASYSTQIPNSKMASSLDSPNSDANKLVRKPAFIRPHTTSQSQGNITFSRELYSPPPVSMGLSTPSGIQYPSMPLTYPSAPGTNSLPAINGFHPQVDGFVSPPPVASINVSPVSRRRSDYIDQSHQIYSGLTRPSIDYPDLSTKPVLRPPPAAVAPNLERQDQRSRSIQHTSYPYSAAAPAPPLIQSDYPVTYWTDVQIGVSGLKNLGNTCYMNSTMQCLSATVPFARFFTEGLWKNAVNMLNPLGSKGNVAKALAAILHELWHADLPYLVPFSFRKSLCLYAPQFGGTDQHDSQEFLSFLLDGLHEDLNRVLQKPSIEPSPEREADLETLPPQIASEQEWRIYRMRNDSIVVDYFQGQFRNRLQCLTCRKTSTTYNPFMYLSLPLPTGRSATTTLYQCLDAFVKEEILEKSDAWNCPRCKTLRKATKQLSISRLPPVLLIHLKRFSFKGPFTDKLETLVDFPLKNLDLTNYVPMPLPPSADNPRPSSASVSNDPRIQLPPYKYDLYAVTNHYGNLTSGHYTAYIASRGGWLYCDDSRVTNADSRDIVGRPAYVLYYKRTR